MRYELEPLTEEEQRTWDARIASYESVHLFHRQVWLDYLAASQQVQIRHWAIRESGNTVGYFCAGVFSKGPFRILGSPLKSWGTNFMGPVVNPDFDTDAFLRALDELVASEGIATLEIENPILGDTQMSAAGYDVAMDSSYIVKLTPYNEAAVWGQIESKYRSKVSKARRAGLTVVESSNAGMTDEYYDQLVEVMTRKGLFPPYDRDRPRLMFEYLYPKNMLLALQIVNADGQTIASGLFPHDETTIYYWGGASRMAGRQHSPNDLMVWSAMEWAAKHGLSACNLCGPGKFKQKFGGQLVTIRRWQKYYSPMARLGRATYAGFHGVRTRMRGLLGRLAQRDGEAG